jgi:hypothetical protein
MLVTIKYNTMVFGGPNLNAAEPDRGSVQGSCPGKNRTDGPVRGPEWPAILRTGSNWFEPEPNL